ncbi:MAG: tetratricopeptide repeat protein [Tannerella sp.]|jgi:tetratricopeptide (TPR) repeat protein|nr:tetratricopeptide repeat protein [Tannerella sp.]
MKIKKGLFVTLLWTTIMNAGAQKGADSGTPFGSGEDSIRCITNISLFTPYAKINNFQDAYPYWKEAYEECPGATKDLYLYGVRIINWQISEEKDPARQSALIEDLMALYDKRIKYFGNDSKYGKDWIVVRKVQDYIRLKGEDRVDAALVYGWLKEVLGEYGEKTESVGISLYMFASYKLLRKDMDAHKGQYIEDFLKCSNLFDIQLAAARTAGNEKETTTLEALKSGIEVAFANSGAADCATLESVYGKTIEENKSNLNFLKETVTLFRRAGCQESELYFLAAGYAHQIEPTAESAIGLGNQAFKKQEYEQAEKYFTEAIAMATENETKADIYFIIANIAYAQKNYSRARQNCLKAIEANPKLCKPYLLIGTMYAATAGSISDDPVIRKTAYYAAIDKFERARQTDSACAEDASRLIATYRSYFPSTEEIFMHPDLTEGATITVGGWIGERTTVRK